MTIAFRVMRELGPMEGWLLVTLERLRDRASNTITQTVDQLAAECQMNRKTVIRYTRELEQRGYIRVKRTKSSSSRMNINVYEMDRAILFSGVPDGLDTSPSDGLPLIKESRIESTTIDPDSIVQESDQEVQREPVQEPVEADGPGPAEFVPPVVRRVFHRDASKFLQLYGVSACERACAVAEERASGSRYGYAVKVLENALETPPPTPSPLTGRGTAPADLDETAEADGAVALEERRHQEWLAKLERGPYAGMYNV